MALLTSFGFSPSFSGTTPAAVFQNQALASCGPAPAPGLEEMLSVQMLLAELAMAMEQLAMGYATYAGNGNANAAAPSMAGSQPGSSNSAYTPVRSGGNAYAPAGNGPNLPMGTPTKVADFIAKAEAQQGKPYVPNAAGPNGFDCSGLVAWALNQAGVKVPRLTADGYMKRYADSSVDKNSLKPGDLIFYHGENKRGIPEGHATHIEIYIGNGMTVGAESEKVGIRTQKINWAKFIGAERVPGLYS